MNPIRWNDVQGGWEATQVVPRGTHSQAILHRNAISGIAAPSKSKWKLRLGQKKYIWYRKTTINSATSLNCQSIGLSGFSTSFSTSVASEKPLLNSEVLLSPEDYFPRQPHDITQLCHWARFISEVRWGVGVAAAVVQPLDMETPSHTGDTEDAPPIPILLGLTDLFYKLFEYK
jgi:hypothetical protein